MRCLIAHESFCCLSIEYIQFERATRFSRATSESEQTERGRVGCEVAVVLLSVEVEYQQRVKAFSASVVRVSLSKQLFARPGNGWRRDVTIIDIYE